MKGMLTSPFLFIVLALSLRYLVVALRDVLYKVIAVSLTWFDVCVSLIMRHTKVHLIVSLRS